MDWSRLPSLSALRAFEATARTGSFSAAGRELNVTAAAVGQQVRALERHLGTGLVRREGRGVALTPAGAELARDLGQAFQGMADAVERVSAEAAARPVHVTMTPAFAANWFMPRYGAFRKLHPEHDLVLSPTGALVDIAGGEADVGIRYGDGDWPGLEATLLLPSDYVIVGAPGLLPEDAEIGPRDLLGLPWFEEFGSDEIWRWISAQGLEREARAHVTEIPGHLIRELLREGHGLATSARVFVEDDLAAGRLKVYWEGQREAGGYWIVHRPTALRPAVRAFLRWLSAFASDKKRGRHAGRP